MADNVDITAGSGTTVATDNIGGINYQRVKLTWGADGTATDASAAAPIPVTDSANGTLIGAVTETAPATDTASSGLNGRLQRIAQRLTSLIALYPSSIGQKAKTTSLAVTLASDEDLLTNVGGLTETAPATDTASSGLNGRLQRIAQRLTTLIAVFPTSFDTNSGNKGSGTLRVVLASDQPTMSNAQPVTPAATESHLGQIGGSIVSVSTEQTRPADTTAYTAGDVVSNSTSSTTLITMSNCARVNAGSGYVTGARLITDKKSITPRLRVHLYNASNPNVAADNAAMDIRYADISKRIGHFDLPPMTTGADSTNSTSSQSSDLSIRVPFVCAGSDRNIYVILEALDAFTPANAEKFTLVLYCDQN